MKLVASLAALGLAATSLVAQSPLTTIFAGPNGSGPGAVTFVNITVSVPAITVNRIDVNSNAAAGSTGRIRVWQTIPGVTFFSGSEQNFANWQVLAEGDVTAAGLDLPSICCFPTPFTLTSAMGPRGYAIEHIGIGARYTNGTGTNQTYTNAEMTLFAGVAASNGSYAHQTLLNGNVSIPFAVALLGGGQARVFNGAIHYAIGTSAPACSNSQTFGNASGGGYGSWYNVDATPAQAAAKLQGKTITMTPNALGAYDVAVGPALPLVPFAGHTALSGYTTTIAGAVATDDGEVATPVLTTPFTTPSGAVLTSLFVHTNGMISGGSNLAALDLHGGDDWAPTTSAMFPVTGLPAAVANPTWFAWHDNDITATGAIRFAEVGSQVVITYDAVPSFGPTGAGTTYQFVFDTASQSVSVTFQTIDPLPAGGANAYSGNPYVVGYTPGGAQLRPEYPIDTTLFSLQCGNSANAKHVALTSTPRPVFGSVINYNVTDLNAVFPLGFLYFSVLNPVPNFPLNLIGIGKPCALLNFDLPNGVGPFSFTAPGLVIALDTNTITPSMLGLDFWGQALVFDLAATDLFASLATSNALHQRVEAN